MTQEIRFDGPAPAIPRKAERIEFVEELKKTPNMWALLGKTGTMGSGTSLAWMIRHAHKSMTEFGPAGAFETEARTLLGEHRVYVRYVGEAKA
jgi:beta-lactamase class D